MTIYKELLNFYSELDFKEKLPPGISLLNPFKQNEEILKIAEKFYSRFYNDNLYRRLILGINPGRFGGGVTGINFTDTKRLEEKCGIRITGHQTYEPSSVFFYEMVEAYGGVQKFYSEFLVMAVCPLGFVKTTIKGKEVNYNYYDDKELLAIVRPFIINNIKKYVSLNIISDVCYCLGTGKNFRFLSKLNNEYNFFEKILALEHPRFVTQYKYNEKAIYIDKYIKALNR